MEILKIDKKENEEFLRKKTEEVDLENEDEKELRELIKEMRKTMIDADGVGLSANQVGLSKKIFVAQIPDENGKPKFYSFINPKIIEKSEETSTMMEGCLSINDKYGPVERSKKIKIKGKTVEGREKKMKVWGMLARVFQHEMDHLNGKLFIDKAKEVYTKEELEKRQK